MPSPKTKRSSPSPKAGVSVNTEDQGPLHPEHILCTCCDPPNPLVMRPDLGTLGDGSAEYALCVLHEPEPVVYRNRGDGIYIQLSRYTLNAAGEIVDAQGAIIAQVAGDGFQRLTTVDDDEVSSNALGGGSAGQDPGPQRGGPASRPRTVHVDLSQDDFYNY